MTTDYNPIEAERLITEAREDDARMQRTPWRRFGPWPQVTIYVDHEIEAQDDHCEPEHVCDVYISDQRTESPPVRCVAEADGIARSRNNLRAMADQLEAARAEIERMRRVEILAFDAARDQRNAELEAARSRIAALESELDHVAPASERDHLSRASRRMVETVMGDRDTLRHRVRDLERELADRDATKLRIVARLGLPATATPEQIADRVDEVMR